MWEGQKVSAIVLQLFSFLFRLRYVAVSFLFPSRTSENVSFAALEKRISFSLSLTFENRNPRLWSIKRQVVFRHRRETTNFGIRAWRRRRRRNVRGMRIIETRFSSPVSHPRENHFPRNLKINLLFFILVVCLYRHADQKVNRCWISAYSLLTIENRRSNWRRRRRSGSNNCTLRLNVIVLHRNELWTAVCSSRLSLSSSVIDHCYSCNDEQGQTKDQRWISRWEYPLEDINKMFVRSSVSQSDRNQFLSVKEILERS